MIAPLPSSDKRLLKSTEAAEQLGIGARTLWRHTKSGAIPVRRIGRSVRYCPEELAAWIAAGCPTEPGAGARIRKGMQP